jgi:hypothetical protein
MGMILCVLMLCSLGISSTLGASEPCFFRVVSTQQTRIVQYDPSRSLIAWTNSAPSDSSGIEMSSDLDGPWISIGTYDHQPSSNALRVAAITNMLRVVLPFTDIEINPAYARRTNAIIHTAEEWTSLWQAQGTAAPTTDVDFTNEMIVVVSMGGQSGPCSIWIDSISLQCGYLFIRYGESYPGEISLPAVFFPRQFVRIQRQSLPSLWFGRVVLN